MMDVPSPGSPVSWQTIFWTLAPLAVNTMSQPGGRVCGLPSRYRTYLRCSPMLCAADSLSVFAHLLVSTAYVRLPARQALGTLLHERFNNPKLESACGDELASLAASNEDDASEGLQSVERMTWLRWLFFVLGTLPPAIKLLSMSGLPWTQVWGAMLLVSWTINESLIIVASLNQSFFTISSNSKISWPGYEQVTYLPRYSKARILLTRLNRVFATAALIVHTVAMNGVFRVLWRKALLQLLTEPTDFCDILCAKTMSLSAYYPIQPSPNTAFAMFIALVVLMLITTSSFRTLFFQNATWKAWLAFAVWLYLVTVIADLASYGLLLQPNIIWIFGSAPSIYLLSATIIVGVTPVLYFSSTRFVSLGKNLLVLYESEIDGNVNFDYGSCLSLAFFIFTVLTSALWYCYVYDPTNTLVPIWTGIFG